MKNKMILITISFIILVIALMEIGVSVDVKSGTPTSSAKEACHVFKQ